MQKLFLIHIWRQSVLLVIRTCSTLVLFTLVSMIIWTRLLIILIFLLVQIPHSKQLLWMAKSCCCTENPWTYSHTSTFSQSFYCILPGSSWNMDSIYIRICTRRFNWWGYCRGEETGMDACYKWWEWRSFGVFPTSYAMATPAHSSQSQCTSHVFSK